MCKLFGVVQCVAVLGPFHWIKLFELLVNLTITGMFEQDISALFSGLPVDRYSHCVTRGHQASPGR